MANNSFVKAEIGNEEKGFKIKFDVSGVFFTVFPHEAGDIQPFELTDITKILFERDIVDYDMELLVKTIKAADGKPVKLVNFEHVDEVEQEEEEPQEPKISLDITKDKMTATVVIEAGRNCKPVSYNMITELLNDKGVIFGIAEDKIRQALEKVKNNGCCQEVIAEGVRPQNGRDAEIINVVSLNEQGRPQMLENGRVDFKNLNLFTIVSQGDVLQERIPHTLGEAGMNVFGDNVSAKPGKMQMLTPGKNVKIVDEHKLVSQIDGQMVKEGKRVSVIPVIQIKGDVDLSTGNIVFNGSVRIKGNVQMGFHVKATGDVEVNGSVCGGIVEGNDIVIKAGIQGLNSGWVEAKRDLTAGFAENAKITASRNIDIKEAVLHSKVNAGKSIKVMGKRGMVVGGELAAGELIDVKTAGNMMNTSMTLEVGVNPLLRKKIYSNKIELQKAEQSLADAKRALTILKATPRDKMSPDRQEMLARLTRSQFPLETKIKELKIAIETLQSEEEALKDGKIKVAECVYPGVRILIGSAIRSITEPIKHSTFFEEDGDVRIGAY